MESGLGGVDPVELTFDGFAATVVPLRAHLARAGALVAMFDASPSHPDVEERELLVAFADQAGLALDRAQAVADREELAVISDRERIARDLHDVVIQRLFATGLQLQGLASIVGSAELAQRLDRAVDDLDVTIKAIRGTIFELQHHRRGLPARGDPRPRPRVRARPGVRARGRHQRADRLRRTPARA